MLHPQGECCDSSLAVLERACVDKRGEIARCACCCRVLQHHVAVGELHEVVRILLCVAAWLQFQLSSGLCTSSKVRLSKACLPKTLLSDPEDAFLCLVVVSKIFKDLEGLRG